MSFPSASATSASGEALALQRPLPDGGRFVVARGEKENLPAKKAIEGLLL